MDKFDRNLDALDYQIAFFTSFGLNGAEIAKQLDKNKLLSIVDYITIC